MYVYVSETEIVAVAMRSAPLLEYRVINNIITAVSFTYYSTHKSYLCFNAFESKSVNINFLIINLFSC